MQRKKDAIDEERYDTSTPNPRHGGASGSSSYSSSRPLDGGVGKDYKKPRSLGGRHERRSKTATTSEHYESPRSLSIHLMAATKEGHMTLDDAYERVLAAPGVVGDNSGVWNTLMSIALRNERWTKAVGFYNEVSLRYIVDCSWDGPGLSLERRELWSVGWDRGRKEGRRTTTRLELTLFSPSFFLR